MESKLRVHVLVGIQSFIDLSEKRPVMKVKNKFKYKVRIAGYSNISSSLFCPKREAPILNRERRKLAKTCPSSDYLREIEVQEITVLEFYLFFTLEASWKN